MIFFDLRIRKAFDSIPHKQLLVQLMQKVVVNGEQSQYMPVRSGGLHAGISAQSIALFDSCRCARLPRFIGGHTVLYEDDLLLFHAIQNQEDYH